MRFGVEGLPRGSRRYSATENVWSRVDALGFRVQGRYTRKYLKILGSIPH